MIKEDYVSFEVAKLLKDKGFNWECIGYYVDDEPYDVKYSFCGETNSTWESRCCSAPTLQTAMKWLREVHNIGIFPSTYTITNSKGSKEEHVYGSAIVNLITFDLMCDDIMPNSSYEQACESAIKYCLENLI